MTRNHISAILTSDDGSQLWYYTARDKLSDSHYRKTRTMSKESTIQDQTDLLPKRQLLVVFTGLALALLTTYIDQNSIGVVLPTIGHDLNSSRTIIWAGTSSLIANTAFQPLYGRLSDIIGRKWMLVGCLCILALGDLLCGFAQTGPQFYAFRGISGMANGGIMALVMMIVSDVVTLEQRGKYQGVLGSCVGLGNTIGPFMAAGFTRASTWRATFYFIAPFAVAIAVLLAALLPRSKISPEPMRRTLGKVDWAGIVLSCAGTIFLLVPVSGIRTDFSPSGPAFIAMVTVGSFLLSLFLMNEWRLARMPMLPRKSYTADTGLSQLQQLIHSFVARLFENKALAAMLTQNFLIGTVFYSLLYYLPIYYQTVKRMSVLGSAALILPLVIAQSIASILSGQYISRMGRYGEVIWAGYACWTLGAGLHLLFGKHTSNVAIVFILIIEGCGVGFVFQPSKCASPQVISQTCS